MRGGVKEMMRRWREKMRKVLKELKGVKRGMEGEIEADKGGG